MDQAKRLKELERENDRLKRAVSELTLDKLILKEALSGPDGQRSQNTEPFPQVGVRGSRALAASVSERRACAVIGQTRATQLRTPKVRNDNAALTGAIVRLVKQYGRYGYPRVRELLVDEGWPVGVKRVFRIWRWEGLKVPKKQP